MNHSTKRRRFLQALGIGSAASLTSLATHNMANQLNALSLLPQDSEFIIIGGWVMLKSDLQIDPATLTQRVPR